MMDDHKNVTRHYSLDDRAQMYYDSIVDKKATIISAKYRSDSGNLMFYTKTKHNTTTSARNRVGGGLGLKRPCVP